MLEEEKKELQRELANLKIAFANHKCKRRPVYNINDESEFLNLLIEMTPPSYQPTSMGKNIWKKIPQWHLNWLLLRKYENKPMTQYIFLKGTLEYSSSTFSSVLRKIAEIYFWGQAWQTLILRNFLHCIR